MNTTTSYDSMKKRCLKRMEYMECQEYDESYHHAPHGFGINLGIKEYEGADYLGEALLGRMGDRPYAQRMNLGVEEILPGAHSYDGSFTSLEVKWKGIELLIETASVTGDIYLRIKPLKKSKEGSNHCGPIRTLL